MSWQGNECFVAQVEHRCDGWDARQLENMSELLWMWQNHGAGWYLLGRLDGYDDEDCYDPFDYDEYRDDLLHLGYTTVWYPNPLMDAGIDILRIEKPHDLLEAAFEMQDNSRDTIGYAGDGEMPFERMVIYGKEYNMARDW